MDYKISGKNILISNAHTFDIRAILHSGQMFRFEQNANIWLVQSRDKIARIEQTGASSYKITSDNTEYFINYFDLKTNYDIILSELENFEFLRPALEFSKGVRILKQDAFETLICFIISANNNIERIKKSVRYLCENFGNKLGNKLFAFPTLEQLSKANIKDFQQAGTGYRAKYLAQSIKILQNGFDLNGLKQLSPEQSKKELQSLAGVGPKVADCVLLFGLGYSRVFPVDTWIHKVYNEHFGKEHNRLKMREHLVEIFGDLSGIAQQYLFYYKRENKNIIKDLGEKL